MPSVYMSLCAASMDEAHPICEFQRPKIRLRAKVIPEPFTGLALEECVRDIAQISHFPIRRGRGGATYDVRLQDVVALILSTTNTSQSKWKVNSRFSCGVA